MTDAAMMPQLRPTPVAGKGAKASGGQKPVLADAFATAVGREPQAQRETIRSAREPAVTATPDQAADAPQATARSLADALAALGARYDRPASAEGEEAADEPVAAEGTEPETETGEAVTAPEQSAEDVPLPMPGQAPEEQPHEAAAPDTDRPAPPTAAIAATGPQVAGAAQAAEAGEIAAPVAASRQADAPALREERRREPATGREPPRAEPAQPAVPAARTAAGVQQAQPATPAIPAIDADRQSSQPEPAAAAVRTTVDETAQDDAPAPRVTIVASQTVAAPAAVLPSPARQLASAMAADLAPASEAGETLSRTLDQPAPRAAPVHSLTIQLQPAELGRVTARMTLADGQLAVAVVVETEEARSRIARDTDMIAGALRQAGYDVDRIVVQHVQPSAQTAQQGGSDRAGQGLGEQAGQAREDQQRERGGGNARDEPRSQAGARSEAGDAGNRRGVYI